MIGHFIIDWVLRFPGKGIQVQPTIGTRAIGGLEDRRRPGFGGTRAMARPARPARVGSGRADPPAPKPTSASQGSLVDRHRKQHVRPRSRWAGAHAHTGRKAGDLEADLLENGREKRVVLETIAASTSGDQLGLECSRARARCRDRARCRGSRTGWSSRARNAVAGESRASRGTRRSSQRRVEVTHRDRSSAASGALRPRASRLLG